MPLNQLRVTYGVGLVGISLALTGCGRAEPKAQTQAMPPIHASTQFDPSTAGTIEGRVTWNGDIPSVPALVIQASPLAGEALRKRQIRANPNAPRIDGATRGVENAVVFLRGVDPERARPWDYPSVVIEQTDFQFHVRQGSQGAGRIGFVRRGDSVTMVSRDDVFHSLHVNGAAFFTLAFPDLDRPLQRVLPDRGVVELTSAAGYYWMRAYLFVADHPYYCLTRPDGSFRLSKVPPGHYELVCWLPNWMKARHERDPELTLITRWYFAPSLEHAQTVDLGPNQVLKLALTLSSPALVAFSQASPAFP